MFDLDQMSRWDEALSRLAHHQPQPEKTDRKTDASRKVEAPARELEDA